VKSICRHIQPQFNVCCCYFCLSSRSFLCRFAIHSRGEEKTPAKGKSRRKKTKEKTSNEANFPCLYFCRMFMHPKKKNEAKAWVGGGVRGWIFIAILYHNIKLIFLCATSTTTSERCFHAQLKYFSLISSLSSRSRALASSPSLTSPYNVEKS
jgi:hypothetical protein